MKRLSIVTVAALMILGQACRQQTNNQNPEKMNNKKKQNIILSS
ncbi:hypothetical protein ABIE26_003860 [Pedobacter africanus]|uniref:Uncharacterized protein n=1 Tax=Pedobacter africanus TaxID=151894 RepID=A0ACC6L161_9SPHI|nr:hypothetical protein [Pedobacter africanus]MDR6785162.1 hypothetical protein [Pedobacter africanus]